MIKNYLKTTIRFLLKNKIFSFINIFGLATGTLCCLYILLYVQDQYSYDKHHKDIKNIYRVVTASQITGDKHNMAAASPPIASALKINFPEVESFTRVISTDKLGAKQHLLHYMDKAFFQKDVMLVDSGFFDVFTYHFSNGSAKGV